MTKSETETLLRYIIGLYPNVKMTEQEFNDSVNIWYNEFKNDPCKNVMRAFRAARIASPDWMPSVPKIQSALKSFSSIIKEKSPEQEFMDRHCGKTKDEWEEMTRWEKSSDGKEAIKSYRNRISELLGG